MNAWIANMIASSVAWIAQRPALSSTLLLVLQIALMIALARILVTIVGRNDPAARHRIWLLTATLVLAIMPIHAMRFGWQVLVPVAETARVNRNAAIADSPQFLEAEPIKGNSLAEFDPTTVPEFSDQAERRRVLTFGDTKTVLANPDPQITSPAKQVDRQSQLLTAAVAVYLLVMTLLTTRAIYGTCVLSRLSRRATNLSTEMAELLTQTSRRLKLSRTPQLKSCKSVSMPFLVGLRAHVVIVPAGFEAWPRADQEAVLLHEMMHIKRNDCWGELVVRTMQIVYFFHPACWYLASKLRESRELATDRGVIELGTDAQRYANSLLSIIAQRSLDHGSSLVSGGLAIPMSAIGKLEDRLNNILSPTAARRSGLVRSLLLLVVIATVATTFRLDSLDAQTKMTPQVDTPAGEATPETTDQKGEPAQQPASGTQTLDAQPQIPQALTATDSENDLYKMVRDCVVSPVTGEDSSLTFNFSGKVVSSTGHPVAGAIVLLREDINQIRRRKPIQLVDRWQYLAKREEDILGKTTTDANGHYEFKAVRAPTIDDPENWGMNWSGGLVVAHQSAGADFTSLKIPLAQKQFTSTVNVSLTPPMKITGRCTTKEGKTVEGAFVTLIESINSRGLHNVSIFSSQIQPRARTKSDGTFEFAGLPAGWIAKVYAYHREQQVDGVVAVATSDDVSAKETTVEILKMPVLRSPAPLQLESCKRVQGIVVDELGNPVSGAFVAPGPFGAKGQTDESGKFAYSESSMYFKVLEQLKQKVSIYVVPPMKSDYLAANYMLTIDEILNEKPLQLTMRKGVMVTGRVLSENGQPIANIIVTPQGDWLQYDDKRRDYHAAKSGVTNVQGEFEVAFLPGTKCELLFATDEPGYALPSKRDLNRGLASAFNSPHLAVEATDGQSVQLKPFIVSKLAPLKISVVRGDGTPASGASVRFREQRQHLQPIEDTLRNHPKQYTTNELGQVSIDLDRMLFDQTLIEATLIEGTQGYFGLTTYVNAKKGQAKIQLKPGKLIQGTVLVNGQTVAGAQVGIHTRTTTYSQQGSTSVRGIATDEYDVARTNDDGSYRVVVPSDREYEVNVQYAGGLADKLLTAVRPLRANSAGVLTGDFNLTLGEYEIAGVVVDENNKPLEHIKVAIDPTTDLSPGDLIAHNQSQFTTDSNGRFSLKNVPEGTYSISARRPPMLNPSNPGQLIEQEPTRVTAKSGDRNLRVRLMR
ncbi:MAG: M56 family metallopeptidase [Pirellulaceae bacterium]|nr:M56 family metallopeptidase [Pirellulaceae bacterium]